MLTVWIEGSSGTPYTSTFTREGDNLTTTCTCPAGEARIHCKHRLSLLAGDLTQVIGDPPADLAAQLAALLKGSDVEAALQALSEAEAIAEAAKADVKRFKKALDRVMHS